MKKILFVLALLLVCATVAQAGNYTFIVESRSPGNNYANFSGTAYATTSVKSTAGTPTGGTGTLSGTGSMYAGDTTPAKVGTFSFTPAANYGGFYNVYATWATNTFAASVTPTWTTNYAGSSVSVTTLNQGSNANTWQSIATAKMFNASTAYTTTVTTTATALSNKRTYADSVAWVALTPTAVTNTGVPNHAINIPWTGTGNTLTWTAGSYDSFFDVFLSTSSNPTTKVASNLSASTLSFDPDSLNLHWGTTYYWKVTGKNVDMSAAGTIWSFTTAPEPGGWLALGTGLIGLVGLMRRRRT